MSYILIIGATSDIATATARQYASKGYDLYLAARNTAAISDLSNDIALRNNVTAKCIQLDVLDYDSHSKIYDSLDEKPVGVIVAAGYLGEQQDAQTSFSETKKIIDTNFTGIVSLLNHIANDFEQRKSGFIIGISSVAGDRGRKKNYIYGAAKAGLTTYLSGLRNRLHTSGVQVLTVKPGFVNTRMTKGMNLPKKLVAEPGAVAKDIYTAQVKGKNVIYTKGIWRLIMLIIKHIPEFQFKKMDL